MKVHLSSVMHDTVAASPGEYLHHSPRLGPLLAKARDVAALSCR